VYNIIRHYISISEASTIR